MTRIDSHLHIWDREVNPYDWITPDLAVLREPHRIDDVTPELSECGVARVVLVQAEDSVGDTEHMLAAAKASPLVAGVVGWIRLDDPAAARDQLERWVGEPLIKGVRHLVHRDPRAETFLDLPEVNDSLELVASHGLVLDVPDAWPWFLGRLPALADRHPGLPIVVDHLGKPPADPGAWRQWCSMMGEIAARPNAVVKVSGLHLDQIPFTAEALRPSFDTVVDLFGPHRLMYGGDWPMTRLHDGYRHTFAVTAELIDSLDDAGRRAVWGGTADRVYGLTTVRSAD